MRMYVGKSPDLGSSTCLPPSRLLHQWLVEVAYPLQWPDRSGFSPDSFLLFTDWRRTKILYVTVYKHIVIMGENQ